MPDRVSCLNERFGHAHPLLEGVEEEADSLTAQKSGAKLRPEGLECPRH
jgi:hypothetical protein